MQSGLKSRFSLPRSTQQVTAANRSSTQTVGNIKKTTSVSSNFQKRMQLKKMMAVRETASYKNNSIMERRLNKEISKLAAGSYGADAERTRMSLQRSSSLAAGRDPNLEISQSLHEKINSQDEKAE